jgi:hypothetical protein
MIVLVDFSRLGSERFLVCLDGESSACAEVLRVSVPPWWIGGDGIK